MACQPNSIATVLDPIRENYDNYLLIDVGSNMVNKKFSRDLESVLQRAKDSGVFRFRIDKHSIAPTVSIKQIICNSEPYQFFLQVFKK